MAIKIPKINRKPIMSFKDEEVRRLYEHEMWLTQINMHIPKVAENLVNKHFPQIRLGLQGEPASGKTTSALTFPNPIVLDCDNGLTKFSGKDILHIPIYDPEWCKEYGCKVADRGAQQPNRRDAITKFLKEDGLKLTAEQTLIIDSWTSLQTFFDQQQETEPKITKTGMIDDFDFWAKKLEYSEKIMVYLCSLKCHVVVCFHELKVRDPKTGQLLDKAAPLMQGKFVAQIKKWFTDFFRCLVEEKKDKEGKVIGATYWWQVSSDNTFDAKTRLTFPEGTFKITPSFDIFKQYARPNS